MSDITKEDILAVVDSLVDEVLEEAEISEPPVDSEALARHLGLSVEEAESPGRPRANQSVIRIDPDWTPERRHAMIAMGIAKSLRDRLADKMGEMPEGMNAASLMNLLGERLLVPQSWFARDAREVGFDLAALLERYRTASAELLALRLLDGVESSIVALIDGDRVVWRRGNGVRANRQLSEAEKECLREVSYTGEAQIVRIDSWTVQGWPLSDGTRFVLRSMIDVD